MLGVVGVPSPRLGEVDDPQTIVDGMLGDAVGNMFGESEFEMLQLPPGCDRDGRPRVVRRLRQQSMQSLTGADFSEASDSEMLEEVLVLMFMPDGAPRPKDSQLIMTPADEPWGAVAELGGLGPVIDQDMVNLMKLQDGNKSDGLKVQHLANYPGTQYPEHAQQSGRVHGKENLIYLLWSPNITCGMLPVSRRLYRRVTGSTHFGNKWTRNCRPRKARRTSL